ncbi:hypothetical protein M422DRAFT_780321 [Sphaerobolus stellatus SS14]|uniref:Uncharacterized protein n=1 Tax=Sphaerobolus stellatus (strain SS14) TaxID=990650 RepID=A0A0C9VTI8_SPHS4|nr:hypothetical protein M422DRAFT_780321 [Sphaerobolus stellatus SS14]
MLASGSRVYLQRLAHGRSISSLKLTRMPRTEPIPINRLPENYLIILQTTRLSPQLKAFSHFLQSHGEKLQVPMRGLGIRDYLPLIRIKVIPEGGDPRDFTKSVYPWEKVTEAFHSLEVPIRNLLHTSGIVSVPFGVLRPPLPGKITEPSKEQFDPRMAGHLMLLPSPSEGYEKLIDIFELVVQTYKKAGLFRALIFPRELLSQLLAFTVVKTDPDRRPNWTEPQRTFRLDKLYGLRGFDLFRPEGVEPIKPEDMAYPVRVELGDMGIGELRLVRVWQGRHEKPQHVIKF